MLFTKSDELKSLIEANGVRCVRRSELEFDNTNPDYYSDLTHMSAAGKEEFTNAIIRLFTDK